MAQDKPDTVEHGKSTVEIIINNLKYQIHRGHQTIIDIKRLGSVALADDLSIVIDGAITPLPDDGAVTIKGGEIFFSGPKDNSSS